MLIINERDNASEDLFVYVRFPSLVIIEPWLLILAPSFSNCPPSFALSRDVLQLSLLKFLANKEDQVAVRTLGPRTFFPSVSAVTVSLFQSRCFSLVCVKI